MDKPSFKLVGGPCGQHGQYTFYKALRITGEKERIIAIGDFFFVRIWQDSELVSIGELQLLWTDRVSDQTLVSLRLYFLPENTPDGRNQQGQDEVLAINDKVVLKAEDLLSWVCSGADWRWGLRAVWRGACAPPANPRRTQPLHHTKLDFSDVEREKSAMNEDVDSPGVVVFSYPRYCRYRALLSRLEGIQGDWLRDSLVAALGGYAAPTKNTRILYCKDTFEYPELEGHEFVCNQLAPKLKGRPRGRRRRRASKHSPSPSDRSSDSEDQKRVEQPPPVETPRRLSLRNGAPKYSDEEGDKEQCSEERAFLHQLRLFYRSRREPFKLGHSLKDLSLRSLYQSVTSLGGYEAACRHKLWRQIHPPMPNTARRHYERFLLPLEKHEVSTGVRSLPVVNGLARRPAPGHTHNNTHNNTQPPRTIATIELPDSREASPKLEIQTDRETGEVKDFSVTNKPAEELNREFLDSLPKEENKVKISVKPVEKLLEEGKKEKEEPREGAFYSELAQKLNLAAANSDSKFLTDVTSQHELVSSSALSSLSSLVNGHQLNKDQSRPPTRSSLRAVRVKPARAHHASSASTTPIPPLRPDSASSSPPALSAGAASSASTSTSTGTSSGTGSGAPAVTNFGIHHPPPPPDHSDDEIVEVPYKPKTPEIIDLDEYPESPQAVKKKKLDILKERGLEVTALPPLPAAAWPAPAPLVLGPVHHQLMTQAHIYQMYNVVAPAYANGAQPPRVIQATSAFGSSGPEKTVYGNPKDPFMPPPHVLLGTPVKPARTGGSAPAPATPPQDVLDLTCKLAAGQKPAVEIVRVPSVPSPSKAPLPKNYTLVDGKAVVGSNLEITLVNPKSQTPTKSRQQQKRSSNGKFVAKTPTPPKDYPKSYVSPSPSGVKKPPIIVPNYQVNQRDDVSPTSSTGSSNSQTNLQNNLLQNVFKGQNSLQQMMDMQKNVPSMPYVDPMYMSALYSSLAGSMDQRQLAMYRDFMANQFRGYSGLLGVTPTTKN